MSHDYSGFLQVSIFLNIGYWALRDVSDYHIQKAKRKHGKFRAYMDKANQYSIRMPKNITDIERAKEFYECYGAVAHIADKIDPIIEKMTHNTKWIRKTSRVISPVFGIISIILLYYLTLYHPSKDSNIGQSVYIGNSILKIIQDNLWWYLLVSVIHIAMSVIIMQFKLNSLGKELNKEIDDFDLKYQDLKKEINLISNAPIRKLEKEDILDGVDKAGEKLPEEQDNNT